MKRYIYTLIVLTFGFTAAFSQATDIVVDCQTPGWLSSKINYNDQITVKNLKVTGTINSDDLKFIGGLMENYQLHGRVDLLDVSVVGNKMGGYTNNFGLTKNATYTIQYLALPKSLTEVSDCMCTFKGRSDYWLKVDTLEFSPNNINYVEAGFFDGRQFESSIKHLILGENIDSIPDNAFYDKGGISSLTLSKNMKYIGLRAFYQNNQSIKDVNFNELTNLKYIGPGAFQGGYLPDTLIIPKTLDNPFILFAFSYRDGQHIFIDENIKNISGNCIGMGGAVTTGYTTAALNIHFKCTTPPSLISYKGNNSITKFGNSTIYVPKGTKQAYLNSAWKYATIIEETPQIELSISALGNGSVSFKNSIIRNQTNSFSVDEGTSATVAFSPDEGYRIGSVKKNGVDVTANVVHNQYTISNIAANTTLSVTFEAIKHSLSIVASGNGYAVFNSTTIRNKTEVFTVNEGASAIVTFTPDAGYKIKSVKLNGTDVTTSVSDSQYTISDISSDTTVEVAFEAITHTLSITASGNGSVTYNGTAVRGKSQTFTVNEGSSATITFAPDSGYRIASVKVDNTDVTANIVSNKYTISNITANTTLSVAFEAITHTLSITASGNGSVTYNSTAIRGKTQTFTINEGTSAVVNFTPDTGYKLKSVKLNGTEVTASVSDNQYTISKISSNTSLEVVFEGITHNLSITASGNGSATYNSTAVRGKTQAFTVNEGTSATIMFTPDAGYRIASVKVNNTDVTANVVSNKYTISNITANTALSVSFEAITHTLTIKATGNGSATYNSTEFRDKTQIFTVNEGTSAVVKFTPDAGYKIKSLKLNGTDATSSVVNSQYTISNIKSDNTLEVEFEAIPPSTYIMNIVAAGNGSVAYSGTTIRNQSKEFTVTEKSDVVMTIIPDNDYRVASVTMDGIDVTEDVVNNKLSITNVGSNINIEVIFEAITHNLNIVAKGNGSATFNGTIVKDDTQNFTVNEGTTATVVFAADAGYKIKSVKQNGTDVTSSLINNCYTLNNIKTDNTIEVEFEAIMHTLTIKATGNGSASYNDFAVRNQSMEFTLQEGSSATITMTADNGYRIKSAKVNNADRTSQVVDGQLTISNIAQNTNVEVAFEEIPPTMYTLNIAATGNGSVIFGGQSIRATVASFPIVEGSYATMDIKADDGYRLKSITVDGKDVTADVNDNQYTTVKIMTNTTITVEFEAVPTFELTITSTAFGSVKYGDAVITNRTETFTVREGESAKLIFTVGSNGRLKSVMLNATDITQQLNDGQYTINDIRSNQIIEAEFAEDITKLSEGGVAYNVKSYDDGTVVVAPGNYGQVLTVPASLEAKGKTWTVTGIAEDALAGNSTLAAVIWEPEVQFTAEVTNPNLLLYVKRADIAPATIQNVVVGDVAESIVLTDADAGNDFYCPRAFTARRITYEHNYGMTTGYHETQGWETIVLPFDVTTVLSRKGTELMAYATWQHGSNQRPYWLYELTDQGWKTAEGIKANTPYIISMPNNPVYEPSYNQTGYIQFVGNNVVVAASDQMAAGQNGSKRLVANYQTQAANSDIYALNVSNLWSTNTDTAKEGSTFIRSLRTVHPFEAYLTLEGANAPRAVAIFADETTKVSREYRVECFEFTSAADWYDLQGRRLIGEPKRKGVYISKGKKVKK